MNTNTEFGCIDRWECPQCHVVHQCDSMRTGQRDGNIIYIDGPCCCTKRSYSKCLACGFVFGFDYGDLYLSPEAYEQIKNWGPDIKKDNSVNIN